MLRQKGVALLLLVTCSWRCWALSSANLIGAEKTIFDDNEISDLRKDDTAKDDDRDVKLQRLKLMLAAAAADRTYQRNEDDKDAPTQDEAERKIEANGNDQMEEDKRRYSFRSDLGKREVDGNDQMEEGKRRYSFRSDLGKRELNGGDQLEEEKRRYSFRSDLGKRSRDVSSYREEQEQEINRGIEKKRYRSFKSDLGKRFKFRSDLGKRLQYVGIESGLEPTGEKSNKEEEDGAMEMRLDKRPKFRTDLGKRSRFEESSRRVFRADLGKRRMFRSDLG